MLGANDVCCARGSQVPYMQLVCHCLGAISCADPVQGRGTEIYSRPRTAVLWQEDLWMVSCTCRIPSAARHSHDVRLDAPAVPT
jgi:hypothetical protein